MDYNNYYNMGCETDDDLWEQCMTDLSIYNCSLIKKKGRSEDAAFDQLYGTVVLIVPWFPHQTSCYAWIWLQM